MFYNYILSGHKTNPHFLWWLGT